MTIALYHEGYHDDVLNLFRQHVPAHFSPHEEKDLLNYLANEIEEYFVVLIDDAVVACGGINYHRDGREARLSWDMVSPDLTGQGIGRLLVEHRLSLIKRNPTVEAIVVRTSGQSTGFYQAMGFQLLHTKKDYWAPGFDLYHMQMEK